MNASLPLSFPVEIMPATLRWFSGAGAIRKMPEDVSLDSVGIVSGSLTEEVFATAVAVIKLDTLTPANLNFKSVRPAEADGSHGKCWLLRSAHVDGMVGR